MKNTSQKVLSIVVLLWILFYLSIALLGQAALEGKIGINLLYAATITALTGLLLIKGFQYLVEKIDQSRGTIVFIVILSVLVVVPRYILNVNFSVLQESDYEKYLTISQYMFLGERIPDNELLYIKEWASNQFIIEKIFSFSYYIWGNIGQQAPLYLNIWFTLGYVLLFYMVCKDLLNKSIAFIAAATLAVWPQNVMNSIYLLSEPMYMFFLFAGIAFCWYGVKYSRSWLWLLGGGLLRISQEIG